MATLVLWVTVVIAAILTIWACIGNGSASVLKSQPLWYSIPCIILGTNLLVFNGLIPFFKHFFK